MHEPLAGGASRRRFLQGVAAGALRPQAAADVASAPLLAQIRLGAEFFLNRTETRDSVFHHFRRMAETGLTVARIFTIWDQVEREQGRWDFSGYDWIYEAAAQHGILIANTLCSEDPPGWMGSAPFYHQWRDLSNPELRRYSAVYLEKVVTRYKDHPAHSVWLLQNEPGIRDEAAPYVLAEYARWLERKYGTVDHLNRLWYRPLRRFAEATPPQEPRTAGWADYPSNLDWRRFRCDHLADQLRWIHAEIDRHHPGALTHINPPGLTGNMPAGGRDLWRLKPTAHFLGTSMHASWHFGMFARADFGVALAYCCDLVRSASAPAPWWITELQAGPTVFTGTRPLNPTAGEITRWLWDAIGNGARGVVFWLWHPRTEGNEAGEWALAGANGEPTPRTRATAEVARVLRRHDDFFRVARPPAARSAILYNRDALILYAVDGWRRPADEIMHSLMGCYKALHRAHVAVDFLDTSELEAGQASRYRVLYLPYCYALSAASAAAIREFVRGGGTVWADGLVGWKDEQGTTRRLPPGPLSDVFGFTLDDIEALAGDDQTGELWRCVIPGGKASVEHAFGKGRALYYGTALSLGYMRRESATAGEWIAAPAREAARDAPVRLAAGPARLSFRVLEAPGRVAAILNNWGEAGRAAVRFPASTQSVMEILSGAGVPLQRTGEASLPLREGASAVLLAQY